MLLRGTDNPVLIHEGTRCAMALLPSVCSSADVNNLCERLAALDARWVLLQLSAGTAELQEQELLRMIAVLKDTGRRMLYTDFRQADQRCECIDYQEGSLRDDFDFGPLVLLRVDAFDKVNSLAQYRFAAFYDLRLQSCGSTPFLPFHLNEYLYTFYPETETSGSQFDYVNPRNREVQVEYEIVLTNWLRANGAWIDPFSLMPAEPLKV